jgi:hypothetical protein
MVGVGEGWLVGGEVDGGWVGEEMVYGGGGWRRG